MTNSRHAVVSSDNRSAPARRFRDLCEAFEADYGGDLSEARRALIRRASAICVQCEVLEGRLAAGEPVDIDLLNRLAGGLRRILESLGLDRKAKLVNEDLTPLEWMEAHRNG